MSKDYFKTLPQYLIPKLALTTFAGFMANIKKPEIKNYLIKDFIQRYQVNMSEAIEENPENYSCFNEFFIRKLKPACRPLANARVISPVDGAVSEIGSIKGDQILQAKGRYYSVDELLALRPDLSQQFVNGRFATLYLAPKDYHRIHMPVDARLKEMIHVPGKLFSVQPTTARVIPHLFARNERLVCLFETNYGLMAMVLVGATIVGSIGTKWQGDLTRPRETAVLDLSSFSEEQLSIRQGDEMGYFKLGSTVILLFTEESGFNWSNQLTAGVDIRFGESMVDKGTSVF